MHSFKWLIIIGFNCSIVNFFQSEKHSKSRLTPMETSNIDSRKMEATIEDLPTEIIQDKLFQYLHDTDIYNLSQTGSLRLKEVSENFIQLGEYFLFLI